MRTHTQNVRSPNLRLHTFNLSGSRCLLLDIIQVAAVTAVKVEAVKEPVPEEAGEEGLRGRRGARERARRTASPPRPTLAAYVPLCERFVSRVCCN
jgi:hypothetical protein